MATKKENTVEEVKEELEAEATVEQENEQAESTMSQVKDERVELYIERGQANEDPNFFVSINGKNYLLPRGKTSLVPPEVKAEVERARRAQEALLKKMDKMQEASNK